VLAVLVLHFMQNFAGEFLGIATEARPVLLALTWVAAMGVVMGWGPRSLRRGPDPATLEPVKESTSP